MVKVRANEIAKSDIVIGNINIMKNVFPQHPTRSMQLQLKQSKSVPTKKNPKYILAPT
jgi:hypothetical protein